MKARIFIARPDLLNHHKRTSLYSIVSEVTAATADSSRELITARSIGIHIRKQQNRVDGRVCLFVLGPTFTPLHAE